jgi:hypothetical protein
MGYDFNLTEEDWERSNKKKSLLKAPISYRAEDLEFPDLESNFTPVGVKMKVEEKIEVVDLKKKTRKGKNKSNKLYE